MAIYTLNEATKRGVQLKVYFQQAFDSMRKADWDTKSIDKCIRDIEKCQERIKGYKNSFKTGRMNLSVMKDKEFHKKIIKKSLGYGAIAGITAVVAMPALPIVMMAEYFASVRMKKDEDGIWLPADIIDLEKENEKALKWLREERKRITSGKAEKKKLGKIIMGTQESSIFESINII